ncbi:MAG: NAD-binding protein, partial [Treponema socranskii subsp. buccale]
MRIVIIGAGFTGVQLAKLLINEKNTVAIIDNDENNVRHVSNQLDCTVMLADGNDLETLEEAGIAKADALVCVTENDEVNMITCSLVDAVYPDIVKIARVRNYAYYVNTAAAKKSHADSFGGKHRPLYGIDYMI